MRKSIWIFLMMLTAVLPVTSCSQNKTSNAGNMESRKTLVVFFQKKALKGLFFGILRLLNVYSCTHIYIYTCIHVHMNTMK